MSQEKKERGTLLVLSGPSGTGKSTAIAALRSLRDFYFSVSFTTRQPREGEQAGVSYNYVDRSEFERMIAAGELLECAEYVGNYYGTSLKVIEEHLDRGQDVLLDIEVQGAAKVRQRCPEAVFVFLLPPSPEELVRRLRERGTDTEEAIAGRLERAREECRQVDRYDYLVVNDDVSRAAAEIAAILASEDCRVKNRRKVAGRFLDAE